VKVLIAAITIMMVSPYKLLKAIFYIFYRTNHNDEKATISGATFLC